MIDDVLTHTAADFTNCFRALALISRDPSTSDDQAIDQLVEFSAPIDHLQAMKKPKYSPAGLVKIKHLLETNPQILHLFGLDPEKAKAEIEALEEYKTMEHINEEELKSNNRARWVNWVKDYKKVLSRLDAQITDEVRKGEMNKVNPKFILRNYLLEEAIRAAEDNNDYSKVENLLAMSFDPFNENAISDVSTQPQPKWAIELCVSCSS